jgi:hypothetical protein
LGFGKMGREREKVNETHFELTKASHDVGNLNLQVNF